jgi:hypothetical protein
MASIHLVIPLETGAISRMSGRHNHHVVTTIQTPANRVSVIGTMTSIIQQRPAQSPAERVVVSIFDIEKVDATPASTTTVAAKNAIPSLARTSSS